jgi:hypothetical protein
MRLEVFISELLFEHDCVVLPEFGGLVSNYRSARLNRRSHVIAPPSKHIGFNRNLKHNDGLLVNHVAGVLAISYDDALQKVKSCIASFEQQLNMEGRLALDRIGVFFKDRGGQLQFIPDEQENYLLSSYGLSPVQLKLVENEQTTIETTETPVVEFAKAKQRFASWKVAAVLAIPLAIGGVLLLGKNIPNGGRLNFASLNPFQRYEVIAQYLPIEEIPDLPAMDLQENPLEIWKSGSEKTTRFDFVRCESSEEGILVVREEAAAPAVTTSVDHESNAAKREAVKRNNAGKYAVIGGAFAVAQNAENFVSKLRSDGFDAEIAGKRDGLTLVAYGFYSSKEEAQRALKNIRSGGAGAWIRRY